MHKNKGRRKIEIKKIEKKDALQVTFSKRRTGIFKKAFELCMLTNAEIAILVSSPGGKAYSFGHPSVNTVIGRFLYRNNTNSPHSDSDLQRISQEYRHSEVLQQLNAEQKRGGELASPKKHPWWETPIEDLSLHELERFKIALEDLKLKVDNRIRDANPSSASVPAFLPEMNALKYVDSTHATTLPPGY